MTIKNFQDKWWNTDSEPCVLEVLHSPPHQPAWCSQLSGELFTESVRYMVMCQCWPPQQGCGFSTLVVRCVLQRQGGSEVWRKDVSPHQDSCTENILCCRRSYTVKLFVRVLLENSVFCWQGNANKMNCSDTIILAKVFRHCVAHHNSLIRRWRFRFHCRQQQCVADLGPEFCSVLTFLKQLWMCY